MGSKFASLPSSGLILLRSFLSPQSFTDSDFRLLGVERDVGLVKPTHIGPPLVCDWVPPLKPNCSPCFDFPPF